MTEFLSTPREETRSAEEAAIRSLYRAAGLPPPGEVQWHPSPRALCQTLPRQEFGTCVREKIYPDWAARLDRAVTDPEKRALFSLRRGFAQDGFSAAVLAQLREEKCRNAASLCFYRRLSGLLDIYHMFLSGLIGPQENAQLDANRRAAQHVEIIIPYQNACLACEPPLSVKTNAQGALHAERTPAVVYRDGWQVCAANGKWMPPRGFAGTDNERVIRIYE